MTYRSPVSDILFSLTHVAEFNQAIEEGIFGEFDAESAASVISEAGRFATDVIAPLNRIGDLRGAVYENGHVSTPPGFREAYRAWSAGGWAGVTGSPDYGGMGLPHTINAACTELWNGASMGFALCPLLSEGAIGALNAYASEELRALYLGKLIAGEWTGTMNLTEPQAGSDLNAVKTRAERSPGGAYRIFGQKIFITYGEHDMADNIVHLVLARLPGAPPGTRGLSLFLVPKFLVKPDGALGPRNDVRCASIEHKLGIHASPTCVMIYGENEGAKAWLIGEENRGLAAMFVMMNGARLGVAFCAHSGHVDCRLSSPGGELSLDDIRTVATECARLLGADFVTYGDDSLAKVCADLLRSQEKMLAVAETATGGLLANAFTDICSASKFFAGGCVCYSNDSKMQLLDVPECLLLQHGAVSAEAAVAMATGAAEKLGADYGLAITGFAGPCGGTNENPVGTIFLALHAPHGVWSRKLSYPGPRTTIKQRAVNAALDWLRRELARAHNGSAAAPKRLGVMQ